MARDVAVRQGDREQHDPRDEADRGHSQEHNKPSSSFIARAQRRKLVVERGEAAAEGGSVFARHLAQRVFANHCRTSPRVEAIGCFPLLTTITALGTPGTRRCWNVGEPDRPRWLTLGPD